MSRLFLATDLQYTLSQDYLSHQDNVLCQDNLQYQDYLLLSGKLVMSGLLALSGKLVMSGIRITCLSGLRVVDECRGERSDIGESFVLLANNGNKTEGEVCKSSFATGINNTGGKFGTGINDTGGKFATGTAGVVDTEGKFATGTAGVVDAGGKFDTGVYHAGDKFASGLMTPVANCHLYQQRWR